VSEQAQTGGSGSPARARLTPYELVFTERFEAEVFPKILAEANRHGVDPLQPDRFQLLAAVGTLGRALEAAIDAAEEDGGSALRAGAVDAVDEMKARLAAWTDVERALRSVSKLEDRGVRIDIDTLLTAAVGRAVGRPDLARAMVASGAATSMKDAFARLLYDGDPGDVPHPALPLTEAIGLLGIAAFVAAIWRGSNRFTSVSKSRGLR
jgi:hypothetical protein